MNDLFGVIGERERGELLDEIVDEERVGELAREAPSMAIHHTEEGPERGDVPDRIPIFTWVIGMILTDIILYIHERERGTLQTHNNLKTTKKTPETE